MSFVQGYLHNYAVTILQLDGPNAEVKTGLHFSHLIEALISDFYSEVWEKLEW